MCTSYQDYYTTFTSCKHQDLLTYHVNPKNLYLVPTVFFNLILWQALNTLNFAGTRRQRLKVNGTEIAILETI